MAKKRVHDRREREEMKMQGKSFHTYGEGLRPIGGALKRLGPAQGLEVKAGTPSLTPLDILHYGT
jgi:hypothetical protein